MSYHSDFHQYPETQGDPRFYQSFQPHDESVRPNHVRGFVSTPSHSYPNYYNPEPHPDHAPQFHDAVMIPASPTSLPVAHPFHQQMDNSWNPAEVFPPYNYPYEPYLEEPHPSYTPQHPHQTSLMHQASTDPFRVADRRSTSSVPMRGISKVERGAWAHEDRNHFLHNEFQPEIMVPKEDKTWPTGFHAASEIPSAVRGEHWRVEEWQGNQFKETKQSELRLHHMVIDEAKQQRRER